MLTSESYTELVSQENSLVAQEGSRSYPALSYEIFLLNQAQQRAKRSEAEKFRQFTVDFDWEMSRRQRDAYLSELGNGSTLVLTDLRKTIVWVSQNFLAMTGFTASESIGKRPTMLQGINTDPTTVSRVSESLHGASSVQADLVNYRKNGEPYVCRVAIDPLYNSRGELTHFLAIENEVK